MHPLRFYATLLLTQFLGSLIGEQVEQIPVRLCDEYFARYSTLPDVYAEILAEHCVLPYIQRGEPGKAWALERKAGLLGKLLERDGPGILDCAAMLLSLHRINGDAAEKEAEILKLRFGEAELRRALEKVRTQ